MAIEDRVGFVFAGLVLIVWVIRNALINSAKRIFFVHDAQKNCQSMGCVEVHVGEGGFRGHEFILCALIVRLNGKTGIS